MKNNDLIYDECAHLFGQLVRKLKLLNKEEKICYGLTLPQCYTIESLGQRGNQTMNELSRDMGVSISTMTRAVDVLVRNKIVVRKENPKDRRQVFIDLTEMGKDYHKKLKRCSQGTSKAILDQIPAQERETILNSLKLLVNAIDAACQKCCSR